MTHAYFLMTQFQYKNVLYYFPHTCQCDALEGMVCQMPENKNKSVSGMLEYSILSSICFIDHFTTTMGHITLHNIIFVCAVCVCIVKISWGFF